MPDLYVLDKNVITDIGRGNTKAAVALRIRLKTDKVSIARAAYDELVLDAPTPEIGEGYRQLLKDLHIDVVPDTRMADRVGLYHENIQYKPKAGQYGQIVQYSGKDKTRPGDMFVAAEARAAGGKLWTFDQPLAKRAKLRQVSIADESTNLPIIGHGRDHPAVARQLLLGLDPQTPPSGKPPSGLGGPPSGSGTPGLPSSGAATSARSAAGPRTSATSSSSTGKSARSTQINLADYPPDRPGPILRFFQDRPVLTKVTQLAANEAAQAIKDWMISKVVTHFATALAEARAEFQAKFPHPDLLWRNAQLDRYRQAYKASLAKMLAPSAKATEIKLAGAIVTAQAPEKNRDAIWREVQARLSKVKLADGAMGGFAEAASAYINAMADLMEQLAPTQDGLPDIATDLETRAEVLLRCGNDLMKTFYEGLPAAAISALTYYPWLDIQMVAQILLDLGGGVDHFAEQVREQANDGERLARKLDQELTAVSDQLAKYVP